MPIYSIKGGKKHTGEKYDAKLYHDSQKSAEEYAQRIGIVVEEIQLAPANEQDVESDILNGGCLPGLTAEYLTPEQLLAATQQLTLQYTKKIHFWVRLFGVILVIQIVIWIFAAMRH